MAKDSKRNRVTYQLLIDPDLERKIQRFQREYPDASLAQLVREQMHSTLDTIFTGSDDLKSGRTPAETFASLLASALTPLFTTQEGSKGEKGSKRKPRS